MMSSHRTYKQLVGQILQFYYTEYTMHWQQSAIYHATVWTNTQTMNTDAYLFQVSVH